MARRGSRNAVKGKGNVIFVNFGQKSTTEESTSTRLDSIAPTTDRIGNPLGAILYDTVAHLTDAGRLQRGRDYASPDIVRQLTFRTGHITAQVMGSQPEPFETKFTLHLPSAAHNRLVEQYLIEQFSQGVTPVTAARSLPVVTMLLTDTTPQDALDGVDTTPDIEMHCSCPDFARGHVCKHLVALALQTRTLLEQQPERLFDLVYLNIPALQKSADAIATQKLESSPDAAPSAEEFWSGGPLPAFPELSVRNSLDHGDMRLLRKAVHYVCFSRPEEFRVLEELSDLFDDLIDRGSFDDPGRQELSDAPTGSGWDDYQSFADPGDLPRLREKSLVPPEVPPAADSPAGDATPTEGPTAEPAPTDTDAHGQDDPAPTFHDTTDSDSTTNPPGDDPAEE
ncbi:hypothetical protein C1Y63_01800 [Corynebacterium sp. 13CS0277]|uniref:SWIM zinc finger family protein n=1 Tax=Corynebacterium sp. 13CS0277 TaxID=2071994 RepID=UPI000D02D556|nr:SWIM zinc finger family protein [Corynebacterium sp. 13CS0277]PRQ12311.1 hypothetical protein C1Y63_01800 [Corynebacterium sp. 13CS0277]